MKQNNQSYAAPSKVNHLIMSPSAAELENESASNAKLGAKGMTTSGKRLNVRTYPKFESLEEERLYRKQHLAAAYRM